MTHRLFARVVRRWIGIFLICLLAVGCQQKSPKVGPTSEITLPGGVKMTLVTIPKGIFQVGPAPQPFPQPAKEVTFPKPFLVGIHEVTQEQFRSVTKLNPSFFVATQTRRMDSTLTTKKTCYPNTDKQSVECVSWYDAVRFCNTLSSSQGLRPCYTSKSGGKTIVNTDLVNCDWDADGFRLPTEAEWEYCCRAGTAETAAYYWGDDETEATMKKYAWFCANAKDQEWTEPHAEKGGPQPVAGKLPNAFGLFDMAGNVSEWCWEVLEPSAPGSTPPPDREEASKFRAFRGGNYNSKPGADLRSRHRYGQGPMHGGLYIGFRIVRVP